MLGQLGRFELRRVLGKGGQSTVFLAHDSQLQRDVAIKVLRVAAGKARNQLLVEARTAGRLRHPNIVTVYEAGEDADAPYIVFEFVDGVSLSETIKERGAVESVRAAGIMLGILDALVHAHAADIVHRDLKPSNILLERDGRPRVMDFGIALRAGGEASGEGLMGTPAYMAPEYIADGKVAASNDIFAAGLVLYEMLFGRRAIMAANDFEALNRIANEPLVLPADAFERADERLVDIIAKATVRDPSLRYTSALQMRQALKAYLELPESERKGGAASASGTLDFLLRRMQHRSDFPAMSTAMAAVNRLARSEQGDASGLAALILKDFALTNKLLRVANSAHYATGRAGTVRTVSRAIVVLGFDAVRSIALSLLLFERLQDKKHAAALKEEFLRANLAGALARELGAEFGGPGVEDYFVCAVFHQLGRLLAHYYLREEALAVEKLIEHDGCSEETAARRVLGLSYADLGVGVARSWGFPDSLIFSMARAPIPTAPIASHDERLRLMAALSNQAAQLIWREPKDQRAAAIKRLAKSYGACLPWLDRQVTPAVERSLQAVRELATELHIDLRGLQAFEAASASAGEAGGDVSALAPINGEVPAAGSSGDAKSLLASGIQDISQALLEEPQQAELLRIVVETAYRALGFRSVVLCMRDERERALVARVGLGLNERLMQERFRIAEGSADLFGMIAVRGSDLLIHDAAEPKVRDRLPAWYREHFFAPSFLLMPLRRADTTVGLLYADHAATKGIQIGEAEFALLRTLRNQAVLALMVGK